MSSEQVTQASRLIRAGQKEQARQLLLQTLKADPYQETAWLWLVETLESSEQRIRVLQQCLKFFPNSQAARRGLERFQAIQSAPPAPDQPAEIPPLPTHPLPDRTRAAVEPAAAVPTQEAVVPTPAIAARHQAVVVPTPAVTAPTHAVKAPAPVGTQPPISKLEIMLIGVILLAVVVIAGALIMTRWIEPRRQAQAQHKDLLATAQALKTQNAGLKTVAAVVPARLPTITSSPTPAPTRTTLPSPTRTQSSTPTPKLPSATLPAPLYFIGDFTDGGPGGDPPGEDQVWRLEQDGETLTQVTQEEWDVTGLDINPLDGGLAYISNNQLYLADADGGNRRVLVPNDALPTDWSEVYWRQQMESPRWSPDGTRLAYALDGIQIIDPLSGQSTHLLTNDIPERVSNLQIYTPNLWSPDSSLLLINVHHYECSGYAVMDVETGKVLPHFGPGSGIPAWSGNQSVYISEPSEGCYCGDSSGLWQVNVQTGDQSLLLGGDSSFMKIVQVGWPRMSLDGRLVYFYAEKYGEACMDTDPEPMNLVASGLDGVSGRVPLSQEYYYINEALWAGDGSLIVMEAAVESGQSGSLWVLPGDGGPATDLKISGQIGRLLWGKMPSQWLALQLTPAATATSTTAPTPLPTLDPNQPVISAQNVRQLTLINEISSVMVTGEIPRAPAELVFWPDSLRLTLQSGAGLAEVRETSSGSLLLSAGQDFMMIGYLGTSALSPDGQILANAFNEQTILLDVLTGRVSARLYGEFLGIPNAVAISAGRKWLAVSDEGGGMSVFDLRKNTLSRDWMSDELPYYKLAFSPDGSYLATCDYAKRVSLWNTADGEISQVWTGETDALATALVFSPDGRTLAVGYDDGTIELWNWTTGNKLRSLEQPAQSVKALAFSPDGKLLAAAYVGGDLTGTLALWPVRQGESLTSAAQAAILTAVAFSPDGRTLAVGTVPGGLQIWRIQP